MDRLRAMATFVKAADLGSFSAAAEALQISPQLAGRHVAQLEQCFGVQLFQRTTRRQSLTDIGGRFYECARIILAEMEAAEGMIAELHAKPSGQLRVNAPVSFGNYALAKALPDYVRENPDVSVELALNNRIVDLVDEGFDVAFRVGKLTDSGLIAKALSPYRLVLCAAPNYLSSHPPIRVPSDLKEHDCLRFGHGKLGPEWALGSPGGPVTVPVTGPFVSDHSEPLLWAALSGLGVALLALDVVESSIKAGRLVEVLCHHRPPPQPMHLLYSAGRRLTPKLKSFIDFSATRFGPRRS